MRFAAVFALACIPVAAAGFRAAAVKVDITPQTSAVAHGLQRPQIDRRARHDLSPRGGAGSRRRGVLPGVERPLSVLARGIRRSGARELERELGISRTHFWWSVTHTHAAPEVGPPGMYKALLGRSDHEWDREYAAFVEESLVRAVKEARGKLEPARIGFGQGISMANINRRAMDVDRGRYRSG